MKLRHFVCGSSALLVCWLAVTFIYNLPAQRYQKPEKFPVTAQMAPEKSQMVAAAKEPADAALSASH